jgi:hypothetical protein
LVHLLLKIVQKKGGIENQPGDNEVGCLSIEHRGQFVDLRALAGGEAEFFQTLFENFRMCRLPSTMPTPANTFRKPTSMAR